MVSGTGLCWGKGTQGHMGIVINDYMIAFVALGGFLSVIRIPMMIFRLLVLLDCSRYRLD